MSTDIQMVRGFRNMLFGGEGLFLATLTGPGKIWLQSMPILNLAEEIARQQPTVERGGGPSVGSLVGMATGYLVAQGTLEAGGLGIGIAAVLTALTGILVPLVTIWSNQKNADRAERRDARALVEKFNATTTRITQMEERLTRILKEKGDGG